MYPLENGTRVRFRVRKIPGGGRGSRAYTETLVFGTIFGFKETKTRGPRWVILGDDGTSYERFVEDMEIIEPPGGRL